MSEVEAADATGRLRRARARAKQAWMRRFPDAVSDPVLAESLDELGRCLEGVPGDGVRDSIRVPASLLEIRRGLLDLWRRSYADELREEASPEAASAQDALDRLLRFEDVRAALEPEWNEQVDAGLGGPRAQDLLAEIGHDLRSPLTSILFLSEVLQDSAGIRDDHHQVRQLGLIYSGALTMLNIVNNFMELVRKGVDAVSSEPSVVSIPELMESIRRTVQPMAEERGLGLSVSMELSGSERRSCHPVILSRVLLNLATNALKYTREGSVRLEVFEPATEILEFGVRDTGPGIEAARLDSIFSVFDPAQDRAGVRFSGSGLGLVIVRRLLRSMHAELECDSEPGTGTRFYFQVPVPEA